MPEKQSFFPHPLARVVLCSDDTHEVIFYCAMCGRPFWADPTRVIAMEKYALCLECARQVMKVRSENGVPTIKIDEDAYRTGYVTSPSIDGDPPEEEGS